MYTPGYTHPACPRCVLSVSAVAVQSEEASPAMVKAIRHWRILSSGRVTVRFTVILDAYLLKLVSRSYPTNCGKHYRGIALSTLAQLNPLSTRYCQCMGQGKGSGSGVSWRGCGVALLHVLRVLRVLRAETLTRSTLHAWMALRLFLK